MRPRERNDVLQMSTRRIEPRSEMNQEQSARLQDAKRVQKDFIGAAEVFNRIDRIDNVDTPIRQRYGRGCCLYKLNMLTVVYTRVDEGLFADVRSNRNEVLPLEK